MTLAPTPKMGLYLIEETLEALSREREAAIDEGDSEALALIDAEIGAYLTKEAAKVDSYAGLIRRSEKDATELEEEAERLRDRAKTARNFVKHLKDTAVEVMARFGVREFKTTRNTMRVQANGGLQPLEVYDPIAVPRRITITLPEEVWSDIVELAEAAAGQSRTFREIILPASRSGKTEPDTDAIREALKRGEEIPGARLLERGEHLRCS